MKEIKEDNRTICANCKKEIVENVKFCPECGKPINNSNETSNNQTPKSESSNSTLSIVGFICAICGIVTCGISSIAGLIISIIASNESSKKGEKDPLATAGIITSAIILGLLMLAFNVNNNTETRPYSPRDNYVTPQPRKKVKVIDFSEMSKDDIKTWCDKNKVNCNIKNDYSNTVEAGGFVSQSVAADEKVEEYGIITIIYSLGVEPTVSQKNAVRKAESYIRYMAFSRDGLIKQLEYEKYSHEDAEYAVDHITVDWNEQAVKKAKSYLEYMGFSRDGLIDQLLYEGFTYDQAVYGVEQNGL